MIIKNWIRMWLWATSIAELICGIPSMFFLFFHPLMITFGFILGICLGGLWVLSVSYLLKRSLFKMWHFGILGLGIGSVGTVIWGIVAWNYLRDPWVIIFIANAFLILLSIGFVGSVIGRIQIIKTNSVFRRSDAILSFILSFNILMFIVVPLMRLFLI